MKRIFSILVSAVVLISTAFFVSCDDDRSSSIDEDYYYTGGGDNTTSDKTETDLDNGSSDENIWEGGQTFVTIPSAPKNVTAKAASSSSIKVSWDTVDNADSYVVYYRPSLEIGNESYNRNGNESTKTTTGTSVSITGLEYKIYLFWVTAKNSAGESRDSIFGFSTPSSSTSSGGSSGTMTTLSAPTGLIATATSSSSVELSWNSVSGATKYFIFQSEYSLTSTASAVRTVTSTSTTVTGLKANTKYYFWVKAATNTTLSDYSLYDYATTNDSSSVSSQGGTLKIINNSSYAIKNVQMYTTYEFSLSGVLLGLDVVISPGYSQTFQNITPGTYVRLGSETYRNHKVSSYKTVIVQSGTTTTITITDSDIISN